MLCSLFTFAASCAVARRKNINMTNIKMRLLMIVELFTVFGCQKPMYYDEDNTTSDESIKKPVVFSGRW